MHDNEIMLKYILNYNKKYEFGFYAKNRFYTLC